jgi:hypothetical protein
MIVVVDLIQIDYFVGMAFVPETLYRMLMFVDFDLLNKET